MIALSAWAQPVSPPSPEHEIVSTDLPDIPPDEEDAESLEPMPPPATPHATNPAASAASTHAPKKAPPPPPAPNAIRIRGLNKVTARSTVLEAPLGTVMRFGNLEIIAFRCWRSTPPAPPENAALLEIREAKPDTGPQTIFTGWMFSSSPALSALEHPVYDVTVLSCFHEDTQE